MDSILGEPIIGMVTFSLGGQDFNNGTELNCSLLCGDTKIKSTVL